ncbi:hypothetical protein HDN1F_01730 [gamma proteobacterium HdN1]|nr:hypothetical protein HDN1F_01730 [gamma proteobacterium HdN1]
MQTIQPRWIALALLTGSALLANMANAKNQVEDDRFIVHYSAFNSTLLPEAVAKAQHLRRGPQIGMVNITVLKKRPDGQTPINVSAFLTGKTILHNGTNTPIEFTQTSENGAVSYIGEFPIANGKSTRFEIDVSPGADNAKFQLRFSQTLFIDR